VCRVPTVFELIQLNIGVFYCNSFYEREQVCDYFFYLLVSPILFLHTSCHVMLIEVHVPRQESERLCLYVCWGY